MHDSSAFYGCWAFRSAAIRNLDELYLLLGQEGFHGAAVSPVEAILHPEPMSANYRFLSEVARRKDASFQVYPVPIIDPTLADWRGHISQCIELIDGRIPACKLLPSYHGYTLELPVLSELAEMLTKLGMTLCIQQRMEDERTRHHTMQVLTLPSPIAIKNFARNHPDLNILICAPYMSELNAFSGVINIHIEMSFVESGHSLRDVLNLLDSSQVLLGTHSPFLMPTAGISKAFADEISEERRSEICERNFMRLFTR